MGLKEAGCKGLGGSDEDEDNNDQKFADRGSDHDRGDLGCCARGSPSSTKTSVEFDGTPGRVSCPATSSCATKTARRSCCRDFVDKPTILSIVYFECPGICTPLLNEVADILGKSNLDPDKQPFQLLSVSFEPKDTPEMARQKQANYLKLVGRELPAGHLALLHRRPGEHRQADRRPWASATSARARNTRIRAAW